jgi:hypothetical protein
MSKIALEEHFATPAVIAKVTIPTREWWAPDSGSTSPLSMPTSVTPSDTPMPPAC